jgi:prefoldin subunit 5
LVAFLLKDAAARHQKETDALSFRLAKLQQDLEAQLAACDQLNTENQNRAQELKAGFIPNCRSCMA